MSVSALAIIKINVIITIYLSKTKNLGITLSFKMCCIFHVHHFPGVFHLLRLLQSWVLYSQHREGLGQHISATTASPHLLTILGIKASGYKPYPAVLTFLTLLLSYHFLNCRDHVLFISVFPVAMTILFKQQQESLP